MADNNQADEKPSVISRVSRIANMKVPLAKEAKEKLNDIANQYINLPMDEAGHGDIGAALAAAVDAAGSVFIPETLADAAMMALGPEAKIGSKAAKGGIELIKAEAKPNVINYAAEGISTSHHPAAIQELKAASKASERMADTLQYPIGRPDLVKRVKSPVAKPANENEYIEVLPDLLKKSK